MSVLTPELTPEHEPSLIPKIKVVCTIYTNATTTDHLQVSAVTALCKQNTTPENVFALKLNKNKDRKKNNKRHKTETQTKNFTNTQKLQLLKTLNIHKNLHNHISSYFHQKPTKTKT